MDITHVVDTVDVADTPDIKNVVDIVDSVHIVDIVYIVDCWVCRIAGIHEIATRLKHQVAPAHFNKCFCDTK